MKTFNILSALCAGVTLCLRMDDIGPHVFVIDMAGHEHQVSLKGVELCRFLSVCMGASKTDVDPEPDPRALAQDGIGDEEITGT